ncbi:MAG: alpha-L-arabinofuranosidase C-terminal domain-containing protein [Terriglobia bacterium]
MESERRRFLRTLSALAAGSAIPSVATSANVIPSTVIIDPRPLFDISPYLYMQFMEPLGITDGSVEAAWDYEADDWRQDLINVVKELSPDVIRFGGLYSRYYKWREGVGTPRRRPVMRNYAWGGIESNRVGTHEFVTFCRRVGAEPLYCVNFQSDGERRYWKTSEGEIRTADATEAADWVSYANDPDDRERKQHGTMEPFNIKLWQLGNETSYDKECLTKEQAIQHTVEFAKVMRQRDPSIQLIGWGDRGPGPNDPFWASDLLQRAGEYLDYVAIHMMGLHPARADTALKGWRYQQEPERAWEELLELSSWPEKRVKEFEEAIASANPRFGIAVTEGHLSLSPYNSNPILYEWLTGVFHARCLNAFQRHGARVKIATAADFFGTRWTVNAVMMPVPGGSSYLMPVGSVMRLFKRHNGRQGVAVTSAPSNLDIAASRSGDCVYLHVANSNYSRSCEVTFAVQGKTIMGGRVYEIAPENPRAHVSETEPNVFAPVRKPLETRPRPTWRFPPRSVSAVELELNSEQTRRVRAEMTASG